MSKDVFVYLWTDEKGRPLYVGKGISDRALRADQVATPDDELAAVLRTYLSTRFGSAVRMTMRHRCWSRPR